MNPEKEETIVITIDGPAGSGKTTTARLLAKRLNFDLLESGSFYRFITYALLQSQREPSKASIKDFQNFETSKQIDFLKDFFKDLEIKLDADGTKLMYKGSVLREELRSKEVEEWVSHISSVPAVRNYVTKLLQRMVRGRCVIAEGRDLGTVVYPGAKLKFFLTASEEVRAKRRLRDLGEGSLEEVRKSLSHRDDLDTKREVSPLKIPQDAIVVDNSTLSLDEVLNLMEEKVRALTNYGTK